MLPMHVASEALLVAHIIHTRTESQRAAKKCRVIKVVIARLHDMQLLSMHWMVWLRLQHLDSIAIASHRLSHLAELLDLALCELLGAQGDMISVCSEAEVIWCVHQAITIHNLRTQTHALLYQIN